MMLYFFFFQAEDGIRDVAVTGVQTCALPISKKNGVTNLVKFRNEDLFQADFHEATVVTLYLLPDLNVKLMPRLMEQLKPGSRIVSHQFDMGKWRPDKKVELNGRTIYLWTIPAKKH